MRGVVGLVLDWSLIDGVVPVVLLGAGVVALGFLLLARRDRRWWRTVAVVAVTAAGGVAVAMVELVVAAPFPDPVPEVVWWAAGAGLLAVGLAGVLLRGSGGRRWLGVVAAVVVVVAAANQVNTYFGQFPTVRAALGGPAADQIDLAQLAATPSAPSAPSAPLAPPVTHPPGSTVAQVWRAPPGMPVAGVVAQAQIPGVVSGFAARRGWVYLPPAYLTAQRPLLPVLVALSGQPGSPRDWLVSGRLAAVLDHYAAAHHGLAPVVVMPDPLGSALANPLCLDSRLGRAQTYLSVDVPAWIRATLQVDPDPHSWAVAGSSAGGTCALQLALTAPQLYPTFLDIAGQAEPTLGSRARTVAAAFGGDTNAFTAVTPLDLLAHHRYPDTAGFVIVGSGDTAYRPQAQLVVQAARAAGLPVEYRELPGGHDWRVSGAGLDTALPWLATRLHLTP